ncbi:protein kinase [Phytophthora infestans T30-4]|uniref:Centriolar satellite-associated tubulin polyglutamylase complex regulator 1 n=1 Tax=Phytophthora infestans (strain T30-4) TaxID=403677 RepID=D0P092_PHYIT|nr:protein kinase [Phytophthora infestans T30-4]EEY70266.1 protein kinase [Phytophthora infestans T30-4]|eukprot:XP_002996986.1 protein kinase [Phytophthora infestans T30-4]
MSRLEAENLIANAYRAPATDSVRENATATVSSGSKLRTLARLPSRNTASSNDFYLQQSGVQFYVDDLVRQLQDKRPDQPAHFIANYFAAVAKGSNVKNRSFEYVNGCLQNRASFLAQLQRSYAKIDHDMMLSVRDFTEMLHCQCSDLPTQLVRQATGHLPENEDDQRRASLRTLLTAFSACFFFNVFEQGARYLQRKCGNQRQKFSIPPMIEVEKIAMKSSSFKEFCHLFYDSPVLIDYISNLQLAFQKLATLAKRN